MSAAILPFPTRQRAKDLFALALLDSEIAHHRWKEFSAEVSRTRLTEGKEAAEAMYPENDFRFWKYRAATMVLARTPAKNPLQLKLKRRAIGKIWLKAEGRFYDALRDGVAVDERRLGSGGVRC